MCGRKVVLESGDGVRTLPLSFFWASIISLFLEGFGKNVSSAEPRNFTKPRSAHFVWVRGSVACLFFAGSWSKHFPFVTYHLSAQYRSGTSSVLVLISLCVNSAFSAS